jgi:hypothetical protein
VNGDYWVVDSGSGVKIVNITPGDAIREGTSEHMNGSMLNPTHVSGNGYDGCNVEGNVYVSGLNVGVGVTPSTPLALSGNASLVSTISNSSPGGGSHVSIVKTAAVLTCLSTVPPAGSFRPAIGATTKTLHNISSINYSRLKSLSCPTTKPNISTYANYFQMVFLDSRGWPARYLHPTDSGMDNYYYPSVFSDAALILNLDYTLEEKQQLVINFIQLGIDLYSLAMADGGSQFGWTPDGGNQNGRKFPIMLAGILLDYAPMRDIGQKSGDYLYANGHSIGNAPSDFVHFGEDGQVFHVTQDDVDRTSTSLYVSDAARMAGRKLSFDIQTNTFTIATPPVGTTIGPWGPDTRNQNWTTGEVLCRPYTPAMIGMPEWGIRHSTAPHQDDSSWGAMYRTIYSGAPAWVGVSLAVRIMGYKTQWNNSAFFNYMDRYMAIAAGNPDPFGHTVDHEAAGYLPSGLTLAMWDTYRADYNSSDTTPPTSPTNLSVE